jgi:hypothetical protein
MTQSIQPRNFLKKYARAERHSQIKNKITEGGTDISSKELHGSLQTLQP